MCSIAREEPESTGPGEHWHATFPATVPAARAIRVKIGAMAARYGLSEERVWAVRLAVSEAATNAIQHAYRGSQCGMIAAAAWVDDGHLRIVIADEGLGMTPRTDSPGLGLGLPLIAALADTMAVVCRDQGGTEIHMAFPAPARSTTAAGGLGEV